MSEPLGVIAPHLDDAVLSCAQVLAAHPGSVVVTVFAGGPSCVDPLPEWDVACHFAPGDDVMAVRHAEDDAAMASLGAAAIHLPFWDDHYRVARYGYVDRGTAAFVDDIATELEVVLAAHPEVDTWLVPLGFGQHSDHGLAHVACLRVAARHSALRWIVYTELPYRIEEPKQLQAIQDHNAVVGLTLEAVVLPTADRTVKTDAVAHYTTQIRALGHKRIEAAIKGPEAYFMLSGSFEGVADQRFLDVRVASPTPPPAAGAARLVKAARAAVGRLLR